MPSKRYHIHLICDPNNQVSMLDGLAIFMENRAFLTHDLSQGDQESASYSRRCIDKCDYLIMLVGDSYGKLNNTGVSQLHLSYIYAKTKAKPILILLKLHNEQTELSRQLSDFVAMVERDNSDSVYYYDDDIQLQTFLEPAYRKFIKEQANNNRVNIETLGWIKLTSDIQQRIAQSTPQPPAKSSKTPSPSLLTHARSRESTNGIADSTSMSMSRKHHSSTVNGGQTTNKEISKTTNVSQKTHGKEGRQLSNNIQNSLLDIEQQLNITASIDMSDVAMISFTTHAYEGGNLADVDLMTSLSWYSIVNSVSHFLDPFTLSTLQRNINGLLHDKALGLVQETIPNAHAVSRTQVSDMDFHKIQAQLLKSGWIEPIKGSLPKPYQELFKVSSKGKKELSTH